MIKEFKNTEMREFGNVYQSMLTQIKKRYAKDPAQAGELAISYIEYVLTGDISSDDDLIEEFVESYKVTTKKAQNRYDAKVAATEEKLKRVADLYNAGWKQVDIAREIGVQPPAISKQLAQIRSDFPHLLKPQETFQERKEISGNFQKVLETQEILETSVKVSQNISEISQNSTRGNVSKVSENFPNNYNDNYNKNKDDDQADSISPSGESGLRPDTSSASPLKKIGGFEF